MNNAMKIMRKIANKRILLVLISAHYNVKNTISIALSAHVVTNLKFHNVLTIKRPAIAGFIKLQTTSLYQ